MEQKSQSTKAVLDILGYLLGVILNIVFYAAVAFALYYVATNAYKFSYQVFGDTTVEAAPGRDVEVTIDAGESSMKIAEKLYMNKVVVNKYTFYLKVRLFERKIQPGTFTLNTSMTYDQILQVIAATEAEDTSSEEEAP